MNEEDDEISRNLKSSWRKLEVIDTEIKEEPPSEYKMDIKTKEERMNILKKEKGDEEEELEFKDNNAENEDDSESEQYEEDSKPEEGHLLKRRLRETLTK